MRKVFLYLSNSRSPLSILCCTLLLIVLTHQAQAQCADTPMLTSNGTTVSATGTSGICLLCSVNNTSNIVNATTTDYGTVSIPVGVLASGYVRLKLPQTYPAGTRVGWIADVNGGLAGLFNGVTLRAYMNGTLVGSVSGGSLFNILGFGGGKNINGVFCSPFNEVEITMGSLAGVLANYNIYYAYITTGCSFPVQCGAASGTEICGDNIDNDGDGLVDNEDICTNPCVAGSTAPALNTTTKGNTCPANTVNLTAITASNQPNNTTLSWHTGTPATTANKITGAAVAAGTYYAAFFDATNNCYSNNGAATTTVTATVAACCSAGLIAPALTATAKSNGCPTATVDLTTLTAINQPIGTTLTWHTGTPATTANKVPGTAVTAGTYYAAFFDALNNCYSNSGAATTTVTASSTACCPFGAIAPILKQ